MSSPQNRSRPGKGRAGTQFRPGQSGNPGGRPKGIRELIQKRVGNDAAKLVDLWCLVAFGDDAEVKARLGASHPPRWQDRMAALQELADRGFGRPTQGLEHEHTGGFVISWLSNES
jgi:hypothetical protein